MKHKRHWRNPVALSTVNKELYEKLIWSMPNAPQELVEAGLDIEKIEDISLAYRWHASDRLVCRVSKQIVNLLTESYFEDVAVNDIYMPEGTNVIQIIPEVDDPICQHPSFFSYLTRIGRTITLSRVTVFTQPGY